MSNVRYFNKIETITTTLYGITQTKPRVIIYQQYTTDTGINIRVPSRLTSLLEKWSNTSISNSKNIADAICPFINYVISQVNDEDDEKFTDLKESGLSGLTYYHAKEFLCWKIATSGISRSTALNYTKHLLDFYSYLIDCGIINGKIVKKPKKNKSKGKNNRYIRVENPFLNPPFVVPYPSKKNTKLTKLVNLDEEVWQLFVDTAGCETPDILLGIALQIFGGLRRGELVNLTIDDIEVSQKDKSKLYVHIKNRTTELLLGRTDNELKKSQPKKERKQIVVNFNGNLFKYLEDHLSYRSKVLTKNKTFSNALFIDEKGRSMSGLRYEQRWLKAKKEFLSALSDSKYSDYKKTAEYTWGCHIGRGIFTNLCLIYKLASTADELRNLRGDSNSESSKPYIDEFKKANLVLKTLNVIGEDVNAKRT